MTPQQNHPNTIQGYFLSLAINYSIFNPLNTEFSPILQPHMNVKINMQPALFFMHLILYDFVKTCFSLKWILTISNTLINHFSKYYLKNSLNHPLKLVKGLIEFAQQDVSLNKLLTKN